MKYAIGTTLRHKNITRGSTIATVVDYDSTAKSEYQIQWTGGNLTWWPEVGINMYLKIVRESTKLPEELFEI